MVVQPQRKRPESLRGFYVKLRYELAVQSAGAAAFGDGLSGVLGKLLCLGQQFESFDDLGIVFRPNFQVLLPGRNASMKISLLMLERTQSLFWTRSASV